MPDYFAENLESQRVGEEIHPGEAIEEKISLSERFGLWISFYPFDQDAYLNIAAHWLKSFGCPPDEIRRAERDALNWALERGSRSGRVAWQFARDWAGRQRVSPDTTPCTTTVRGASSTPAGKRSGNSS
jgi:predicted AAA+ superfamily ATPase